MSERPPENVTQLLLDWSKGDERALSELMDLVYAELRGLAERYLRRERPDGVLQATALVHDAYIRLIDQRRVQWQNRAHFFGVAAQMMRRILVDHARSRDAQKRGGGRQRFSLSDVVAATGEPEVDLVELDQALTKLTAIDEQQARIVELRFFSGLTIEETAAALGISPATVKREWRTAKAWLHRELNPDSDADA